MRTKIIKIGNSRGIRIPSPLLKESGITNNVDLKIGKGGLILRPILDDNSKISETLVLSEETLTRDWNRPEEDAAWENI